MTSNLSRIIRKIKALRPESSDVLSAMRMQEDRIKLRTVAGVDVNGIPFPKKKDGSASHLVRTGRLLRSLQSSAGEGDRGLVGLVAVTGRAREYAPYVNVRRRFLGASQSDRREIVQEMRRSMNERRNDA